MKNNVHNQLVKQKYTTLYQRITKALETGKFYTYTNAKKQAIFNRLKRYENRLKRWGIAVVSAAALFVTPMTVQAQTAPTGSEFQVNTYTTNNQAYPVVAMDNDGDYVVVWQSKQQDGTYYSIYAQRYNNMGAAVGSEFRVNTDATHGQKNPSVAMDNDGDFVITWDSYGQEAVPNGYTGIYAQRFDNTGAAVGGEFLVNTTTLYYQQKPSVAMDDDGDFVITWESDDGAGSGIYAQRYDNTGATIGGEFQVNTTTASHQEKPAIAMDADGDFVIAWESNNQDDLGNHNKGIYAQRYNNMGVAVGGELLVNTTISNNQQNPSIAMDSDGDFVITWESFFQDGSQDGIYAQRYDNTGVADIAGEFQVNTFTTDRQFNPVVAMDSDGDFVITWQSNNQDGSYYGIYAQQYDNAGATVGGEVHVSTTTTNKQEEPAIAMDNDGDFIIAWADQGVYNYSTYTYDPGQDGDGSGIYAQRFGTFVLPVELTDFMVQTQDNQTNLLLWQTATEENNKGFEVQKSMNGQDFETIDFVQGKGMTIESQNYTFTDEKPNNGINYYRLKQIDFDGAFEYSEIRLVELQANTTNKPFSVYPNPVRYTLTLENTDEIESVIIHNVLGQPMRTINITTSTNQLNVEDLTAGQYYLQANYKNGNRQVIPFLKK